MTEPDQVPVSARNRVGRTLRRRRILDAAAALFEARGFEGATTDDIAAAAQVTKRTLYRYVGSKEELLHEIHEDFLTDLLDEVAALKGTPTERFRAMVTAHIEDLASHLPYIKVFFEEIKHLSSSKREQLVARRQKYEELVNKILEDGIAERSFRDLDVRSTTRSLLGAMNEGYRWYRGVEIYTTGEIAGQVNHLFLNGLASPAHRASVKIIMPVLSDTQPSKSPDDPMSRILRAATGLFRAQGYHRTSTQEIADAAGLTKGALFYHVRYKEEALVQIHHRLFGVILQALEPITTDTRPPLESILGIVTSYVKIVATHHEAMGVILEERKYLPPESVAGVLELEKKFQTILETAIRRGMLTGEIATEDPNVSTLMVFGMMNSLYRWFRPEAGRSSGEFGADIARLVLLGIVNHPSDQTADVLSPDTSLERGLQM